MKLGFIGLGKMGKNMVLHLVEQRVEVVAYNRTRQAIDQLKAENPKLTAASTIEDLVGQLPAPRIIWLMVAAGTAVDELLDQLIASGIQMGDIVIDGGNSFYKDTIRRSDKLSKSGIHYVDCGTSGGLEGGRSGACLMLGGDEAVVKKLSWLWDALVAGPVTGAHNTAEVASSNARVLRSLSLAKPRDRAPSAQGSHLPNLPAVPDPSWTYFGPSGAGHFVKMVHNGVEYGMDQAIGEGFAMLSKGPYNLDLRSVAKNWNHGSIVRGYLLELLVRAFSKDPHLDTFTGKVGGGETGAWARATAKELGIEAEVIEEALEAREKSRQHPTFATKVVSALRREYGGHEESK